MAWHWPPTGGERVQALENLPVWCPRRRSSPEDPNRSPPDWPLGSLSTNQPSVTKSRMCFFWRPPSLGEALAFTQPNDAAAVPTTKISATVFLMPTPSSLALPSVPIRITNSLSCGNALDLTPRDTGRAEAGCSRTAAPRWLVDATYNCQRPNARSQGCGRGPGAPTSNPSSASCRRPESDPRKGGPRCNGGGTVGRLGSKRVDEHRIETEAFNFGLQTGDLISFAYWAWSARCRPRSCAGRCCGLLTARTAPTPTSSTSS